jgi:hypothetical protein
MPVIHKVWVSEFLLIVLFFILSVIAPYLSYLLPWTIIDGQILNIGQYEIRLKLPLLWFAPFLTLFTAIFRIYNCKYIIDQLGLEARVGILTIRQRITRIRFEDIRSNEIHQNFWGRLFDTGALKIGTAGTDDIEIIFDGVGAPKEIHEMVDQEKFRHQQISVGLNQDGSARKAKSAGLAIGGLIALLLSSPAYSRLDALAQSNNESLRYIKDNINSAIIDTSAYEDSETLEDKSSKLEEAEKALLTEASRTKDDVRLNKSHFPQKRSTIFERLEEEDKAEKIRKETNSASRLVSDKATTAINTVAPTTLIEPAHKPVVQQKIAMQTSEGIISTPTPPQINQEQATSPLEKKPEFTKAQDNTPRNNSVNLRAPSSILPKNIKNTVPTNLIPKQQALVRVARANIPNRQTQYIQKPLPNVPSNQTNLIGEIKTLKQTVDVLKAQNNLLKEQVTTMKRDMYKSVAEADKLRTDLMLAQTETKRFSEQKYKRIKSFGPIATESNGSNSKSALIARVKKVMVNLRTGPGLDYPSLMVLPEGSELLVQTKQGEWFKVFAPNGTQVWVQQSGVDIMPENSFSNTPTDSTNNEVYPENVSQATQADEPAVISSFSPTDSLTKIEPTLPQNDIRSSSDVAAFENLRSINAPPPNP